MFSRCFLFFSQDLAKILLTQPVCTQEGEKIALSRRVDKASGVLFKYNHWYDTPFQTFGLDARFVYVPQYYDAV